MSGAFLPVCQQLSLAVSDMSENRPQNYRNEGLYIGSL